MPTLTPTRSTRDYLANVDEFVKRRPHGMALDDMDNELMRLHDIADATTEYVRKLAHLAGGLNVALKSKPDLSVTRRVILETIADDLNLTPEAAAVLMGVR